MSSKNYIKERRYHLQCSSAYLRLAKQDCQYLCDLSPSNLTCRRCTHRRYKFMVYTIHEETWDWRNIMVNSWEEKGFEEVQVYLTACGKPRRGFPLADNGASTHPMGPRRGPAAPVLLGRYSRRVFLDLFEKRYPQLSMPGLFRSPFPHLCGINYRA